MNTIEDFDADEFRSELECMEDDELFGEDELAELAETRINALVEQYEEQLDAKDMSELYGEDVWEKVRSAKVEERINARFEAIEQLGQ